MVQQTTLVVEFRIKTIHQETYESTKYVVSKAVTVAYPGFSMPFEVYRDSPDYHLREFMVKTVQLLAFYSRNL